MRTKTESSCLETDLLQTISPESYRFSKDLSKKSSASPQVHREPETGESMHIILNLVEW